MSKIVHFVKVENKFEETWEYECKPIPEVSIDAIAYLLFSDESGFWLGKVNQWNDLRQIKNQSVFQSWVFKFSEGRGFGSHATDLLNLCNRSLSEPDIYQIEGYFDSGHRAPQTANTKNSMALDLSDGRDAIANYYRVESRQVEIFIKSN